MEWIEIVRNVSTKRDWDTFSKADCEVSFRRPGKLRDDGMFGSKPHEEKCDTEDAVDEVRTL